MKDKTVLDPFYLIVGHVSQLELLVPHGVKLVQLRLKGLSDAELRRQIARGRDLCAVHGAQLVVNDHWELALEMNCNFVHLGQEDLDQADLKALRRNDVRFGISTHVEAELERALACDPAYVALGPVYETKLKKMPWAPQGLEKLSRWKQAVGDLPLVAIGGLTPARLPGVFQAGADSAAVVTDIQLADNPEARTLEWLEATR